MVPSTKGKILQNPRRAQTDCGLQKQEWKTVLRNRSKSEWTEGALRGY